MEESYILQGMRENNIACYEGTSAYDGGVFGEVIRLANRASKDIKEAEVGIGSYK